MNGQVLYAVSAVPHLLKRAFCCADYAHQFIAGRIRFGLLQNYRQLEDERRDVTEGRASIRWNLNAEDPTLNNITYSGTSLNPFYILCTSHFSACGCQMRKFGSFIVQIHEPLALLRRICSVWNNETIASSEPFITPVLYNKDVLVDPAPYLIAPPCLAYAQKPTSYCDEMEYRYVLPCKVGIAEENVALNVGSCEDICSFTTI